MGIDPGVRGAAEASLRPWLHGHPELGQQLLPQLGGAGAVQHTRLPAEVSEPKESQQEFSHLSGMSAQSLLV